MALPARIRSPRSRFARSLVAAALTLAAACHHPAPAAPVVPPPAGEVALAPAPFTAAQLRDASPAGRWLRFHMTTGDAGVTIEYRFTAVDATGATIATIETPDGGAPAAPTSDVATWDALSHHADSPAAATVIRDAQVTVAAGTFACKEYVVTTRDAGVTRVTTSAFAIDLPGPPVKMTVVADGQPETTLELIAHGGP